MEYSTLVRERYSCRAYRRDKIPSNCLDAVLEAARLAPTACNRQPFRLLVLDTDQHQTALRRIYPEAWFVQAPLVLGIVAMLDEAWSRRDKVNYAMVDATIAFDHLILAATDQGLGTCWVAAFDPKATREVLNLPSRVEPVAFTPLGWPADNPGTKKRQSIRQLVRFGPF